MAFTKDVYADKAAYAARRMAENAEIKTLSDEQHDALARLCEIRHWIHSTDEMKLFNAESSEATEFSGYLKEIEDGLLWEVGLPSLETIDFYSLPTSSDFELLYTEEERQEYGNDFDRWLNEGSEFSEFCDMIHHLNNDIERYLKAIDNEHGTHYCPTGLSRV